MNFKEIRTVDDVKSLGSLDEVRSKLQDIVEPLKVSAETYDELLDAILVLKKKWIDLLDGPFISEQAELVYYLTKLEGKQRNKALSITDDHYENKEIAKDWYRRISQKVHADKGGSDEAFHVLKSLYDVMITDVDEDENE